MKKLTALLLTMMLALCLTACAGNDTKKLAGTWTYSADITSRMNEEIKTALELDEGSPDAAVAVYLTFTVEQDGAYTLALDTDAIETDRAAYMEALKPVLTEALYSQAETDGYTREQYDKALESMGMTADECVAAITDAFDMDTFLSLLGSGYADNTISAGYCKAEEGRLYFSDTTAFDETDFVGYTLAGDIMTWTDEDGALAGQLAPAEQVLMQFPAEWTKAAA